MRALTGWYPYKTPAYELNVFLSWIGFDSNQPRWLAIPPRGKLPGIGAEPRTIAGGLEFFARAGLPPIWCEVRGRDGSTRAPGTYTAVRDLLAPLGYVPHRFRAGERVSVSDDDVTGREDVLFAAASPL